MATVEDKQKTRFISEIHENKAFLITILSDVSEMLSSYEEAIDIPFTDTQDYSVNTDLEKIRLNFEKIKFKHKNNIDSIEMNKQRIVSKIEKNSSWIENPFHYYESRKNTQIMRFLMANEINNEICKLKALY